MTTPGLGEQDVTEHLRDLEAMLGAITDHAIFKLDVDGNVASWSAMAQRLKGYAAAEVIGRPVSIFYTEEDQADGLVERELRTARETGRFEVEGWRIRKDGSRFWANVILAPIRDDGGALTGFVKVTRDITDQREKDRLLRLQHEAIMELSTPVIQVWERVLVLPIIGTLDSTRAGRLTEGLLDRIAQDRAEVVILDVSGVPTIDTMVAQHLLRTVQAASLMGASSILSGVRPETAQAIVRLGVDLGSLRSRATLRDALELALQVVLRPVGLDSDDVALDFGAQTADEVPRRRSSRRR